MRKQLLLIVGRVTLILLSSVAAALVFFWVTEHFFFDRLFYQKSILHGYYVPWQSRFMNYIYGKRDEDQRALRLREKRLGLLPVKENVLGVQKDSSVYTVALIGDSFAWGVGVRYSDSISQQLEKKLNKYRRTKVLNLSYKGDEAIDYLATYEIVRKEKDIDIYIFELVVNDMLISQGHTEKGFIDKIVARCQHDFFPVLPVYDIYWDVTKDVQKQGDESTRRTQDSLHNPVNFCILDEVIGRLPKERSVYFITNDFESNMTLWKPFIDVLAKYERRTIFSSSGKDIAQYHYMWEGKDPYRQYFRVSAKEGHPSRLAHEMYAELLYRKIVSDVALGFIVN